MPSPEKFKKTLLENQVDWAIIDEVFQGYEKIVDKSPKKNKASFFHQAIDVLEKALAPEQVKEIVEGNACCKSGVRERNSKKFAGINDGLGIMERLEKINKAPYLNMGHAEIDDKGDLIVYGVSYMYEGKYECGCPTISRTKRDYPISKGYCFCCGGHFKYHYEIMLCVKLNIKEVISSPLDSSGESPCVFRFEICN